MAELALCGRCDAAQHSTSCKGVTTRRGRLTSKLTFTFLPNAFVHFYIVQETLSSVSLSAVVASAMAPLPAFPDPAVRWRVLVAGLYGMLRRQVEGALRASVRHRGRGRGRSSGSRGLGRSVCGRVHGTHLRRWQLLTGTLAFMVFCSSCS